MAVPMRKPVIPPLKVVVEWSGGRQEYDFTGKFRIGRLDDCGVCIRDEHVSRAHAEISFEEGAWCGLAGTAVNRGRDSTITPTRTIRCRGSLCREVVFDA